MNIAALLTCHNRKDKTQACLSSLFFSVECYNCKHKENIVLYVYITDDGCTDGTTDAIHENFPSQNVNIVFGSGHCYWAGGMRLAWKESLKSQIDWDFFLLLNDDVLILEDCLNELLETHNYSLVHYNKSGIYSGICYSIDEPRHLTYSGCVFVSGHSGAVRLLDESDVPQLCDITNANILLVHKDVYNKLGIFFRGFIHGGADHDYSFQARKAGFPVLISANCCGYCDNDHLSPKEVESKLKSMTLRDRLAYFRNPVHSIHDYILGAKRRGGIQWLFSAMGRYMIVLSPTIYYWIFKRMR